MTKYNNKKTVIDNITFNSKDESLYYEEYYDRLIELLNQKYGV